MTTRHMGVEDVGLYLSDAARVERYGQPEREHQFAKPYRLWRLDYAYPLLGVAIEVEGGTFHYADGAASRHTTGAGYADDCRKYTVAALLGWLVVRLTTDMLDRGEGWVLIDAALELRRSQGYMMSAPLPIPDHLGQTIAKLAKRPQRKRAPKKASAAAYASL